MKKIFSVSKITALLLWRNGTIPALTVLITAFAVFIFFATNSNNNLTDELHLRLKYSLICMSVLVNCSILYLGVFSLRKDIDERRFHTIAAAPVFRFQIWLGKFIGISFTATTIFLIALATIAISSYLFIANWDKPYTKEELKEDFITSYMECKPDLSQLNRKIQEEFSKKLKNLIKQQNSEHDQEGDLEGDKWRARKYLLTEIKKEKQIIKPKSKSSWRFFWDPRKANGNFAFIKFKTYSNNRKIKVKGIWSIIDENGKIVWKYDFENYPYLDYKIKIPMEKMPKTKNFTLVFNNIGNTYLIFPIFNNGLTLFYPDRNIFTNCLHFILFSFLGIAITTALALTSASIFSFPVAIFVAFITFSIGNMSNFFTNIIQDLNFHNSDFLTFFYKSIISLAIWITQMLKTPPVSSLFSDGISIPSMNLLQSWGISFILYFLIIIIIGTKVLKNKELDKILSK